MLTTARETALIATLGTEPQVVTVTLDLLIEQGITFDEVVVIHTAPDQEKIKTALATLDRELASARYHARVLSYHPVLLQSEGRPIQDIYTEQDAGAVFTLLYRQVLAQKTRHRIVHLNAAGGRKGMMIFGMATAQILFDDADCLWLLSSTEAFTQSRELHRRSPADARLIPIPVLRWSRIPQVFTPLLVYDDPFQAINYQREFLDAEDRERKERFLASLSEPERRIVEVLVRQTHRSNKEIGELLGYATHTVNNYLTTIYDKARSFFGLRQEAAGKREVLVGLLASYFEWLDRQKAR